MITLARARQFAEAWVEAWNAHNLARVIEHYSDDFVFSSPLMAERGFAVDGTLRGKAAMRSYGTEPRS